MHVGCFIIIYTKSDFAYMLYSSGAKLKLMSQASTLPVVTIEGIRKKKGTLFIKTSGKLHFQKKIGSKVYILGPWTEKIKVIDKDYLFMVLLNAFKGVLERI